MKGDFSRLTFDSTRAYASVLLQQGRVAVDADWNEQQLISHYLTTTAIGDIAGASAAPQDAAGFAVTAAGANLQIGAGRIYVGGVLCAADTDHLIDRQPHLPDNAEIFQTAADTHASAPTSGRYLVFLDVWSRLITALEDPDIKDSALDGADTAARLKTVWQVRGLRVGTVGSALACDSAIADWDARIAPPTGRLAARAKAAPDQTELCIMPETAGYRRLENQLYRIEIHDAGTTGTATFKWSRDNAAFAQRWLASNGVELVVASAGRDGYSGFRNGQWIELLDEAHELTETPGTLVRIATVRGTTLVVDQATATGSIDHADFGALAKIRAWDSAGTTKVTVPGGNDGFLAIEDGLEIGFAPSTRYRSGDYWLVPARTASGIAWPEDNNQPTALPPYGPRHGFAKLALADFDGAVWTIVGDCRALFPPLTGLEILSYLGGDGQEVAPDPLQPNQRIALAQPLRVGVSRGRTAIAGARIRFRVLKGNGQLAGGGPSHEVTTGPDGIATCAWSLDGATQDQQTVAELLSSAGQVRHLPVTFTATLSRADEVSFNPANTPALGGESTVQGAIEALADLSRSGCATYVVAPGSNWLAMVKSLKPGEDAHLCFQRGDFKADQPAVVSGLGHITLSGCGAGSRITVSLQESALRFEQCASVTIRDLHVAAPDGSAAIKHLGGRNGAITVVECPIVNISDVSVLCGAGAAAERTCITVRGSDRASQGASARSVHIKRNHLTVGYGQDGILVTDCQNAVVEENELAVAPRKSSLGIDRLLADPTRRKAFVKLLVNRPVRDPSAANGSNKTIKGGKFTALFRSTVPQSEWDALVAAAPPGANDLRSRDRFDSYARKLIDGAVSAPNRLPSFDRQLGDLKTALGDQEFNRLRPEVRKNLLVTGDVRTGTFDQIAEIKRSVSLVVGNVRVLFDSPVSQADWNAILRIAPPGQVRNGTDLVDYARRSAVRLLVDEAFRNRLPSAKAWFAKLKDALPAAGRQAIVCGGARLGFVRVANNRVYAFEEGAHIGVSQGGDGQPVVSAQSIAIHGNDFALRLPYEGAYISSGVFVGNADTVRVERNTIRRAIPRPFETVIKEGIRVWGALGPMVQIRENDVTGVATGIRVYFEPKGKEPAKDRVQWLAADNLVRNALPASVLDAPASMERRNNKPA